MDNHRKRVKHYHEPGDIHELTFSCYGRRPLLNTDSRRRELCRSIDRALRGQSFRLIAFVLMPEHVHLLVYSTISNPQISKLLSAIKRPFSFRMKQHLSQDQPLLLHELTIQERPGKMVFRFWQEGGGYDRNLSSESAVMSAIDYIHMNPVRRGLVSRARDWNWSSALWHDSDRQKLNPDLPTIHGLPGDFFTDSSP